MALSAKAPITPLDIQEVVMLKFGKVFLLKGYEDDSVVVKLDVASEASIKSMNPFIKQVDKLSTYKILTPAERGGISAFAMGAKGEFQQQLDAGLPVKDARDAVEWLGKAMRLHKDENIIKMEPRDLTDLDAALVARLNGDKTGIKGFIKTLSAPDGLEKLGEIFAVDMFIGNQDRFRQLGGTSNQTIAGRGFSFKALANIGNVFSVDVDGVKKIGALDFIDPTSQSRDMHVPFGTGAWTGRVLADRAGRKALAKAVMSDLEQVLSPNKGRFSLRKKLPSNAVDRFEKGIVKGARLIAAELKRKFDPNKWTAGTQERYNVLKNI